MSGMAAALDGADENRRELENCADVFIMARGRGFVNARKKENYEINPSSGEGQEVSFVPNNKSTKTDDQRNNAHFKDREQALRLNKMARLPASLNGINKNLP